MAKWGENDPRWIVEKREDGTNVNHWHWTESDWTSFAKERLIQLLTDLTIETDQISCKTKTVTVSGDVSVNTRKKKTILFYELDVTVQWEGVLKSDNTSAKGTIQMPYISDENDDTEFEIRLTVEDEDIKSKWTLKDHLRTAIIPILKERIPIMLKELKQATVEKTKLPPKKSNGETSPMQIEQVPEKKEKPQQPIEVRASPPPTKQSSSLPKTSSFKLKEKFVCSTNDLYECFVHPGRVRAYAGDSAQVSSEKGGKSVLFGGSVLTENVEMIPGKKIVQKWRFKEWPESYYSTVTLDFETKENKTILNVHHEGVPDSDRERTEQGWSANYFARIKGIFGYGAMIF